MKNPRYEYLIDLSKQFSKHATYGNLPIPKNRLFLTPSVIGLSDVLCFRYGSHIYRVFWQSLQLAYWEECERLAIVAYPPPLKCSDETWAKWEHEIFLLTHDVIEKQNLIIKPFCKIKQLAHGKMMSFALPDKNIAPETVYKMALSILKHEKTMVDFFPNVVYTQADYYAGK